MASQEFPEYLIDLIISDEEFFVCNSWRLNTTQATAGRELSDYLTFKLEFLVETDVFRWPAPKEYSFDGSISDRKLHEWKTFHMF